MSLNIQGLRFHNLPPFDLTIEPGTIVTLSGPSGVGKTLFLRAIVDLDCNEGEVLLNDMSRSQMHAPAWRQQVGFLPAESSWWMDTVVDHFATAAKAPLTELGLQPEALQWQVARLSSGERQRLALARLLAQQPKALLLDEPTANLDQTNIERVESLLKHYVHDQQIPTIWISHDLKQCQRIGQRHFDIDSSGLQESPWT